MKKKKSCHNNRWMCEYNQQFVYNEILIVPMADTNVCIFTQCLHHTHKPISLWFWHFTCSNNLAYLIYCDLELFIFDCTHITCKYLDVICSHEWLLLSCAPWRISKRKPITVKLPVFILPHRDNICHVDIIKASFKLISCFKKIDSKYLYYYKEPFGGGHLWIYLISVVLRVWKNE